MKNIAVYAGTFDPVTYGHIDLVERAANIFEKVIVAIAASPNKKPLLTLEERVMLTTQVFKQRATVVVEGFDCLLLDFVKQQGASIILRGLRTVTDFEYEFQLASMNRRLNPAIETLFLVPAENFMYVSSSLVREIASLGGDVRAFVPENVVHVLNKKFDEKSSANKK